MAPAPQDYGMIEPFALIGFGEAGETFAGAAGWGGRVRAFDIAPERAEAMARCGVNRAESMAAALASVPLALSLVTADQALVVARDCAAQAAPGALWCDMNSVAPQTKRQAGEAVEAAGGRYIDVAILAPVQPAAMAVPLLLSGPAAGEAARLLEELGFTNTTVVGAEVGQASSIKMIRSVMVKGVEALTAEMMLAADQAGVSDHVLASLDASEKRQLWRDRAAYSLERMTKHGLRRAAEMEESAATLEALGVEPVMTRATIRRQREMAGT